MKKVFLYKVWKKAYEAVRNDQIEEGVEDAFLIRWVPPYRSSKHSSITGAKDEFTPEQLKHASMHEQVQSFEHYLKWNHKDQRRVYEEMCPEFPPEVVQQVYNISRSSKSS